MAQTSYSASVMAEFAVTIERTISMTEPEMLRVLIASYEEPAPANSDYEAVKQIYE